MYDPTNPSVLHTIVLAEEKGEKGGSEGMSTIVNQGGISDFSVEARSEEVNHE